MSQGLISSWKDKGSALEGPMEDRNERQNTITDTEGTFERHTEEQRRRETTTKEEFKKKSTSSYTLYILFLHFVLFAETGVCLTFSLVGTGTSDEEVWIFVHCIKDFSPWLLESRQLTLDSRTPLFNAHRFIDYWSCFRGRMTYLLDLLTASDFILCGVESYVWGTSNGITSSTWNGNSQHPCDKCAQLNLMVSNHQSWVDCSFKWYHIEKEEQWSEIL